MPGFPGPTLAEKGEQGKVRDKVIVLSETWLRRCLLRAELSPHSPNKPAV